MNRSPWLLAVVALSPLMMAATCGGGGGRGGDGGTAEYPDVGGTWSLTFANDLTAEVNVGGSVYNPTIGSGATTVSVTHDGKPISYSVDCSKPLVVCPSELLPATVSINQSLTDPRNISLQVTESECRNGTVVEGTCSGTLVQTTTTRNGTLSADGTSFTVVLGGGAAATTNCVLLTLSVAQGDFTTSGSAASGNLRADSIVNGKLTTAVGGGCVVVNKAGLDPAVETAALAASIKLTSSFTATHVR